MLNRVRKFLRGRSPDWLNTEVNKDLLQNLTVNFTSSKTTLSSNSYQDNYSPLSTLGAVRPRVGVSEALPKGARRKGMLTKTEGLGERAKVQPVSKQSKSSNSNYAAPSLTDDRQFSTADSSLFPAPGTPHWRRITQVFLVLDNAPKNYTYDQLIEYVRQTTGKGCSRKLISKWKKYRQNSDLPSINNQDSLEKEEKTNIVGASLCSVDAGALNPLSAASSIPSTPTTADISSTVNNFQLIEPASNFTHKDSLNRPSLLPAKAWSYLAAAGITVSLVGCELLPLNRTHLTKNPTIASITTTPTPLPVIPERRKNRLEPRNIKIELTLSSPQDLKVKPGEQIAAGQILSDRSTERHRLEAKKKQLQLSLEKLNLPLSPIPQPKPLPEIAQLPPVSYAEAEAAIKLKQQKLQAAETAIANQQKKIDQIRQLFDYPQSPETKQPTSLEIQKPEKPSDVVQPVGRNVNQSSKAELVLKHEQTILENLQAAQQSAQIQLEIAQSQLTTAQENRAYTEYQRQLEQTRRAIAVEQQRLDLERREAQSQRLIAEREYSQAQIEAQIQEIDYQIEQLSTVHAPYEGTIKKIKWTGQSDHNLTVELTLELQSHRSTIANRNSTSIDSSTTNTQ